MTIDRDVLRKAKERGLNVSKVSENDLKDMTLLMEGSNQEIDAEQDSSMHVDERSPSIRPRTLRYLFCCKKEWDECFA